MEVLCYVVGYLRVLINVKFTVMTTVFSIKVNPHDLLCPFFAYFYVMLKDLREPTWKQWREFLVKYSFLPYQLIAEFAWDWLEVHYWTSRFLIVNAMLLSVLELFSFWRIWSRSELK